MKPKYKSRKLLAVTQSKAKHYEFNIPEEYYINISGISLYKLLSLTIGIIGDISSDNVIDDEALDDENEIHELLFSAHYFDALIKAEPNDELNSYYKLLGACAYYLNGLPGSAIVLIKDLESVNLNVNWLDRVLLSLLRKTKFEEDIDEENNIYSELLKEYIVALNSYYDNGGNKTQLLELSLNLREKIYEIGTNRELLFVDLICSITKKYTEISLWATLPRFSSLDASLWESYIKRNTKIKELWPSQIKLGEESIFKGASSVIQMPTSAGKTKSMELLIRSSVIGRGVSLVVLVAPFRALCQEIYVSMKKEFSDMDDVKISLSSDVIQNDYFNIDFLGEKNVLILTPEKLIFIIRNNPDVINRIGLIIFDEGHLFDDHTRGVKYELLIASLKSKILPETQVILISAVVPNAEEIGSWLLGDNSKSISVNNYSPTNRNIAFVSWRDRLGQLYFVENNNIDSTRFFVPRVLEQRPLSLSKREKKERHFPESEDENYNSQDVSLLLGCQLIGQGSVAIFSGIKSSIRKMINRSVEIFDRQVNLEKPILFCNLVEIKKFKIYLTNIYGENSEYVRAAELGIFAHHADVPKGVRFAIEHGIEKEDIKYIICTSTLAQGVNMPIKYLIISSHMQGGDIIKTRDFHNLIGRVGRAGFYTEGTVIFADNSIYDGRIYYKTRYRWNDVKGILDPSKSEACRSFMYYLLEEEPEEESERDKWAYLKKTIDDAIKDYLLYSFSGNEDEDVNEKIKELVQFTFAYNSFNSTQKTFLLEYFNNLYQEIISEEPDIEKRKVFSKSMSTLTISRNIYNFIEANTDEIKVIDSLSILLELLWGMIYEESGLSKIGDRDITFTFCNKWINGDPFPDLYDYLKNCGVKLYNFNIDLIIHICENIIGYESSLLVSSFTEILKLSTPSFNSDIVKKTEILQKALKYGISDELSIALYEMGICDRKLSIWISDKIRESAQSLNEKDISISLVEKKDEIIEHINLNYPSYFLNVFNSLIKNL